MKVQNRSILLFLNNFAGHVLVVEAEEIEPMSNIKVEWLPPNCTSLVQPVDQIVPSM